MSLIVYGALGRGRASSVQPGASLTLYGGENQDREAVIATAPFTRRRTVSVRFVGLADCRARSPPHGGTHWPGDDGSGDGTGRGPLLNGLAAGSGSKGGYDEGEGNDRAFHGEILAMAQLQRDPLPLVPARPPKSITPPGRLRRQQ